MAITIRKQPQELQPVYNEIIFVVSTSNATKSNFNFISEIIVDSTVIAKIKYPVNPEGFGILDVHKHLQSKVTHDFGADIGYAKNSNVLYDVNFSEEFRPIWDFTTNSGVGSGQIGFTSLDDPSDFFTVGDTISIEQDSGYTYASYNGNATIVSISYNAGTLQYLLKINKPANAATGTEPGIMSLSNQRTKVFPVEHTVTDKSAFNGVLDFIDYIDYDSDVYTNDAPTDNPIGKFLTTLPTLPNGEELAPFTMPYKIKKHSKIWLNSFTTQLDIVIEVGNTKYVYHYSGVIDADEKIMQYGVGFDQLNASSDIYIVEEVGGVYTLIPVNQPFIAESVRTYKVYGQNANQEEPDHTKQGYVFNIEDNCSVYEDIQLVFLDKLGSFVPFHFDLMSKNTKNIKKTNYQTDYGKYANVGNSWNYKTSDRGTRSLDTTVNEVFTINSNWIKEDVSNWLMELFTSPEVFWVKDNQLLAINVTTSSVEKKKQINNQLINHTLTFELANKNKQQLG